MYHIQQNEQIRSEVIPELRMYNDQGVAFLAEDNAGLVLVPVELLILSCDQIVVGAMYHVGWNTRCVCLLWYYPVAQAIEMNNSCPLTI